MRLACSLKKKNGKLGLTRRKFISSFYCKGECCQDKNDVLDFSGGMLFSCCKNAESVDVSRPTGHHLIPFQFYCKVQPVELEQPATNKQKMGLVIGRKCTGLWTSDTSSFHEKMARAKLAF